MKTLRIFVVTFVSSVITGLFAQEPASVFLTAGQSNADGRETIEFLPPYLHDGYKYLHYANVTSASDGTFSKFKFGKRFAFCDITNYYIEQALLKDFYAIKCAYGGTSITPGATHAHLPVWYADKEWVSVNKAYRGNIDEGKSLTLSLTEGFKDCAEVTLSKLSQGYDVKAIMWHQGESDRRKSGEYYKNFKDMITFMREQIYWVTGDEKDKTLPFIFGTVPHGSRQYNAEVEKAQLRVAGELPNVYAINLKGAGLRSDALHFDGPWTEYVGKMMYNKLVELGLVKGKVLNLEKPHITSITDNIKVEDERQWHFNLPWDENTVSQLNHDTEWVEFKDMGYRYQPSMSLLQELKHNGSKVKETEGLFFKSPSANRVILNPGKYICLYSDNISLIIPKVSSGQTIAITTESARGERGLTSDSMEYLELVSGGVPAVGKVTNIWKVKDNVKEPIDLSFHPVGGGVYIYTIEITLANL